jgi:redox-sensitive bicupin YhaK (pirin superfamily)
MQIRVLAGSGFGVRSPVETSSPTFLADVQMAAGAEIRVPALPEAAVFVVDGKIRCEDTVALPGTMLVFSPEASPILHADEKTRLIVIGGDPLDKPRYIWWNFVSSSPEHIVEAARRWRDGQFPKIPHDDVELVPLPGEPHLVP